MVRTQIQLSEQQFSDLKARAAKERVSISELVRQGITLILSSSWYSTTEERKSRAIEAAGAFHSGKGDLSTEHDKYLGEAFK